jgi:hypothetical protein
MRRLRNYYKNGKNLQDCGRAWLLVFYQQQANLVSRTSLWGNQGKTRSGIQLKLNGEKDLPTF